MKHNMRIVAYPSIAILGALAGMFICRGRERAGSQCCPPEVCKEDQSLREHLSECQIDTMLKDTFPASDPPSTY